VLPDEKLMLPVLHGISSSIDKLNVTMGFPLGHTPMFNLIELLLELQIHRREDRFNHKQVVALLGHPYVVAADPKSANDIRKEIFRDNIVFVQSSDLREKNVLYQSVFQETNERHVLSYLRVITEKVGALQLLEDLDKEYATHFVRLFNRMEDVLGTTYSNLKAFLKLFRQLVKTQKIPFTGEPLRGLQVMGVLETRNLDFKNVFVLSLNEGSLPSGNSKGSYIPYNIRKAYKLPTPEHQDAMYAYLFYRVLQRAEKIFLFYNSETDVLGQGEMSRFLQQLLYESQLPIRQKILHNSIQPLPVTPIIIQKDENILVALGKLNDGNFLFKGISPSALNTYIECKLRFYFKNIAKLKEPNEVEEDIDARIMGNFLHHVMELFYLRLREQKKSKHVVEADYINVEQRVDQLIEHVFREQYKIDPARVVIFEGQRLVVKEVVKQFASRILAKDKMYTPFVMEGIEQKGWVYKIKINKSPGEVIIGGNIDRIDRKDNRVRIIDYKTGRDKLKFESIESLFEPDENRNKAAFQTFLYSLLYRANNPSANADQIMPGLINRVNLFEEAQNIGFSMNQELISDILPLLPEFETRLKQLLEEVFDPAIPFEQTEHVEICRNCPYQHICYR
jgi:CRISPR/Cas system-associated exonuclease Cas4 (RecB family)